MFWDTHMHCNFSGDSEALPEDMIEVSIQKGLSGICFTDHIDWDYPGPTPFSFDAEQYFHTLRPLQEAYKDRIEICLGVELGLQPHLKEKYDTFVDSYPFDFVIGSSHVVNHMDPYYGEFYEGKTEYEAYLEYFESVLENLSVFDNFDVYGHIDYVVRYGPNKNDNFSYTMYKDVIDEILKTIIEKGKGLELNMSGFKYGLGHPNPCEEILSRYKELGGEILTLGADAHQPAHIAYDYYRLKQLLLHSGFSYYTVFQHRKPHFLKVDS